MARKPINTGLYWIPKPNPKKNKFADPMPNIRQSLSQQLLQLSYKNSIFIFSCKCCSQHKLMYNLFLGQNMKIDKPALKESIVDTLIGAVFNFPLSWLTITLVLLFTQNSFLLSLSQLIVLSIIAIIRRYYVRVYFDKQNKRNGL